MRNNGFSLLELIVVILVIAVLSGIAVIGYKKVVEGAREKQAFMAISAIAEAQNRYRLTSTAEKFATIDELLDPSPYTGLPFLNQGTIIGNQLTGTDYQIVGQETPTETTWGVFFYSSSSRKCYCIFEDGHIRHIGGSFFRNCRRECTRTSPIVTN